MPDGQCCPWGGVPGAGLPPSVAHSQTSASVLHPGGAHTASMQEGKLRLFLYIFFWSVLYFPWPTAKDTSL